MKTQIYITSWCRCRHIFNKRNFRLT